MDSYVNKKKLNSSLIVKLFTENEIFLNNERRNLLFFIQFTQQIKTFTIFFENAHTNEKALT